MTWADTIANSGERTRPRVLFSAPSPKFLDYSVTRFQKKKFAMARAPFPQARDEGACAPQR